MIKKFQAAKDLILKIEKGFPVNNWKLNDIHLWPFIRIQLFFYIIEEQCKVTNNSGVANEENTSKEKAVHKIIGAIKKVVKPFYFSYHQLINFVQYKLWLNNIKPKFFLFVGHNHHRVDYLGKKYNRFYDPLIEKYKLENEINILEYWCENENTITHQSASIKYEKGKKYYNGCLALLVKLGKASISNNLQNDGYASFLKYLDEQEISIGFSTHYKNLSNRYKYLSNYNSFYKDLLNKIKPNYVFTLCYYIDEIMLLINTANIKGINTLEMQHGPIAQNHLSYGNWSNIPTKGYNCLPKQYWCWDETSKLSMDNLVLNSDGFYNAFIGGHPWVNYWQSKIVDLPYSNFVLYTLQPIFNPQELFPTEIINIIKTEKYKWLIRLHPRQLNEKESIVKYLVEKEILDLVDIETATNEVLPVLLKNTLVHVTNSSGATLEAAMFNKTTILLDELGKKYFEDFLNNGKAFYLNPNDTLFKDDFLMLVDAAKNIIQKPSKNTTDDTIVNGIFAN